MKTQMEHELNAIALAQSFHKEEGHAWQAILSEYNFQGEDQYVLIATLIGMAVGFAIRCQAYEDTDLSELLGEVARDIIIKRSEQ